MIRACTMLLLPLALAACGPHPQHATDATPPTATSTAPATVATPASVETPSASLAGVAHDADLAPADLSADDTYALPGAFAPDIRIEQLEQRFGKGNVRAGDVPGAEGETSRGVILFPDDPTRRAYLYYEQMTGANGLDTVRIVDEGSRWHFDNGVRIGTPLSKLVALNGKPIRFYGFDWDYGGGITDWNGGALAPAKDNAVIRQVQLTHVDAPMRTYPVGEGEFSSDDPRYPRLGEIAVVGEIAVSFPGEDDL